MQRLLRILKDTRGAGIALVAISMVALLSAVALAVDVGMLMTARTEAQLLGDAAALEGARILRDSNGDSAQAHDSAVAYGSNHNTVRGSNVAILNEDVDVIPEDWTVRVRVHRTAARNSAVETFFAKIFGVNTVNISTNSAAWAVESTTVGGGDNANCLLPVALVDDFTDLDGDGVWDEGEPIVGYDQGDNGKLIKLKIHNNDPNTGPPACQTDDDPGSPVDNNIDYCQDGGDSSAWRCWWREDEPADGGGGGTDILGPRIYPAEDCGPPMSIGDTVWSASGSGNKQSLVSNDDDDYNFEGLINSDPDLEWCSDCANGVDQGCVVESGSTECFTGESTRMRVSPVVDPSISGTGAGTTTEIVDFIGVFVERVACAYSEGDFGGPEGRWNVYVRLIVNGGSGSNGGDDAGDDSQSLIKTLQLIE